MQGPPGHRLMSRRSLALACGKVVAEEVNDFLSASFAKCSGREVLMQETAWQNVIFKGWSREDRLVRDNGYIRSV